MRRQHTSARQEARNAQARLVYLQTRLSQLRARQQAGYTTSDKGGKLDEIIPVLHREALVILRGQDFILFS